MKLCMYENGQKILYVEMSDILFLQNFDLQIPDSIYSRISSDFFFIYGNHNHDFIDFEEEEAILFFQSLDWILDYHELDKLSIEEVQFKKEEILEELAFIKDYWMELSLEEKRENQNLRNSFKFLNHQVQSLDEFIEIKKGILPIPYPIISNNNEASKKKVYNMSKQHRKTKSFMQLFFPSKKSS